MVSVVRVGHRREGRGQVMHRDPRMASAALALCLLVYATIALGLSASEVFRRVAPSVVVVLAVDGSGQTKGLGSGVVVAQDRVITNCHVSDAAAIVYVKRDGARVKARIIERAADKDLCLLEVATGNAPVVKLRRSADVQIGEPVYAIGNPQGLEQTLSPGLISQLRKTEKGLLLQTTAPISSGSSGGGLFDEAGLLIGITVGQYKDAQNLNFAIPADWIDDVLRKPPRQTEPPPRQVEPQRRQAEPPPREAKGIDPQRLPESGRSFRDCADCPEMVVVPAGSFMMGSPEVEQGRSKDESPQHKVQIPRALAIGKAEITRAQFARFVADSGHKAGGCWSDPGFAQTDDHPVVCINWHDADAYTQWLARKTGKNYRLLSEAEWEYAARAGQQTARYWGEAFNPQGCKYANIADFTKNCGDGQAHTAPVGSYQANSFGLHDMIGNAAEWTQDCWNDSYSGAPENGDAWSEGNCDLRVLRGGGWSLNPDFARAAYRYRSYAVTRFNYIGLRLARTD